MTFRILETFLFLFFSVFLIKMEELLLDKLAYFEFSFLQEHFCTHCVIQRKIEPLISSARTGCPWSLFTFNVKTLLIAIFIRYSGSLKLWTVLWTLFSSLYAVHGQFAGKQFARGKFANKTVSRQSRSLRRLFADSKVCWKNLQCQQVWSYMI